MSHSLDLIVLEVCKKKMLLIHVQMQNKIRYKSMHTCFIILIL